MSDEKFKGPWKGPKKEWKGPRRDGPRRDGPGAGGFGGPKKSWGGPRRDGPGGGGFGGPKKSWGGPRRDGPGGGGFGGPKKSWGGPRRDGPGGGLGGPKKSWGGPRRDGPGGGFGGPRREGFGGGGGGWKGPRRDGPGWKGPRRDFNRDRPQRAFPPRPQDPALAAGLPAGGEAAEGAPETETPSDDFVYGRHPVLELLKAEGDCKVNKLWLLKGAVGGPVDEIVRLAEARRIVFQWVERDRLTYMVRSENHQGVVARVGAMAYATLDYVLQGGTPSPIVLLDGIEDPHNLGAILRSAAFFGAKAVAVPRWRSAGLSATVMKASAGALAKVPLVQVTNIAQTLLELKEKGYWIYGADGGGAPAPSVTLNAPVALVIGAEGTGLHRLVKERCDQLVAIPGSGGMESLNASCAAAVLLHEVFRRDAGR